MSLDLNHIGSLLTILKDTGNAPNLVNIRAEVSRLLNEADAELGRDRAKRLEAEQKKQAEEDAAKLKEAEAQRAKEAQAEKDRLDSINATDRERMLHNQTRVGAEVSNPGTPPPDRTPGQPQTPIYPGESPRVEPTTPPPRPDRASAVEPTAEPVERKL